RGRAHGDLGRGRRELRARPRVRRHRRRALRQRRHAARPRRRPGAGGAVIPTVLAVALAADTFSYRPAGELVPGSGMGRVDATIYAPDMLFPIEDVPDFANSQVWGH